MAKAPSLRECDPIAIVTQLLDIIADMRRGRLINFRGAAIDRAIGDLEAGRADGLTENQLIARLAANLEDAVYDENDIS